MSLAYKNKKIVIFLIVIIALGCILAAIYQSNHQNKHISQKRELIEPVITAEVIEGEFTNEASALASIETTNNVLIKAETPGRISRIYFKSGDWVKKGVKLISFEKTKAQAQYDLAFARFNFLKQRLDRTKSLNKVGAQSKEVLEEIKNSFLEAKANLELAKANLADKTIYAPFSGQLSNWEVTVNQFVNQGATLVTLIDTRNFFVEYRLPEKYISNIAMGQLVKVSSNGSQSCEAQLSYISPFVEHNSRTVKLRAEIIEPCKGLMVGQSASVSHDFGQVFKSLIVPESSLITSLVGYQVFRVNNQRAESVPVKIGSRINGKVQILSGLKNGDIVVEKGHQKLKDGARVRVATSHA